MKKESGARRVRASNPNKKHVCRICNKGFTSGKALGGHMRIHASSDDTKQLDLSASLPPCWTVTARRGRERLASCKSTSPLLPGIELRIIKSVVDLYSVVCVSANHRDGSDAVGDDEFMDKTKRRKTATNMESFESSEITEPNIYTCSISFPSHQASGGHKANHYYQANNVQITNQSNQFKVDDSKKVSGADS